MTKRAKLITALVAAIGLVLVTPLASVAYWAVSTQLPLIAQASTFSVAPYTAAPASAASSTSFTGWSSTQYYTAPLTNNGATPWASQAVTVTPASGFGPAAIAKLQIAFTTASGSCQTDATYAAVTAQNALATSSWASPTVVAPGASIYACVKLVVTDTDTQTRSGQPAPAPKLTLTATATAAQRNWTDQESTTLTISSTGWAACTTSGNNAVLTLPTAVPAGTYTVVRNDNGATFTGTVSSSSPSSLTLTNPATSGSSTSETYVTIKNAQGTTVAVANLTFKSSYVIIFFTKSVVCA